MRLGPPRRTPSISRETEVGDCLEILFDDDGRADVSVVPSSEPHFGEVRFIGEIDSTGFADGPPSNPAVRELCTAEPFTSYVGTEYDDTDLGMHWFSPSFDSWAGGDRSPTCLVTGPGREDMVGSARGRRG